MSLAQNRPIIQNNVVLSEVKATLAKLATGRNLSHVVEKVKVSLLRVRCKRTFRARIVFILYDKHKSFEYHFKVSLVRHD